MLGKLLKVIVSLAATVVIAYAFLHKDIEKHQAASQGRSYEACQPIEHLSLYYRCMKNVAQNRAQACLNFDEGNLREDCFANVDHERANFIFLEKRPTSFSLAPYRMMIVFVVVVILIFALFTSPVVDWFPRYRERLNTFLNGRCASQTSLLKISLIMISLLVLVIVFLEYLLTPLLN